MSDDTASLIEYAHPDIRIIDGEAVGLKYGVDDSRAKIMVCGVCGKVLLTAEQAAKLTEMIKQLSRMPQTEYRIELVGNGYRVSAEGKRITINAARNGETLLTKNQAKALLEEFDEVRKEYLDDSI